MAIKSGANQRTVGMLNPTSTSQAPGGVKGKTLAAKG